MSGADNIQFNNLERALSTDLNNTEAVLTRTAADNLRYRYATQEYAATTAATSMPSQTIQNVVLGGLAVTPSGGTGVFVSPGVLCQDSASLTPTPGTYDSDYRIARLEDVETVAALTPGTDVYYLLEAQMMEVIESSQIRDIYNPSTETFVPTSVPKVIRRTIQFQWTAGTTTNFPVPTGGNWVPIAGLFRPAAGGNVTAAQIYDMRIFPKQSVYPIGINAVVVQQRSYGIVSAGAGDGSYGLKSIAYRANLRGEDVWIYSPSSSYGLPFEAPELSDPVNNPALASLGTWCYLYLAPWSALRIKPVGQTIPWVDVTGGPSPLYLNNGCVKGVVVSSTVAPANQGEITNGFTITLPSPFQGITVAANQAVCVAAMKKESGFGWFQQTASGSQVYLSAPDAGDLVIASASPFTGGTLAFIADAFPKTARSIMCRLSVVPNGAASGLAQRFDIRDIGFKRQISCRNDDYVSFTFDYDLLLYGTTGVTTQVITATDPPTATVLLEGYNEASG